MDMSDMILETMIDELVTFLGKKEDSTDPASIRRLDSMFGDLSQE